MKQVATIDNSRAKNKLLETSIKLIVHRDEVLTA